MSRLPTIFSVSPYVYGASSISTLPFGRPLPGKKIHYCQILYASRAFLGSRLLNTPHRYRRFKSHFDTTVGSRVTNHPPRKNARIAGKSFPHQCLRSPSQRSQRSAWPIPNLKETQQFYISDFVLPRTSLTLSNNPASRASPSPNVLNVI